VTSNNQKEGFPSYKQQNGGCETSTIDSDTARVAIIKSIVYVFNIGLQTRGSSFSSD